MPLRLSVFACALALPAPTLADVPPPPPPVMDVIPVGEPRAPQVMAWQVSEVTCGPGVRIAAVDMVLPNPQPLLSRFAIGPEPVTVTFAIDAEGRAHSMTSAMAPRLRAVMSDLMPSLRASRFAVRAPQTGCAIGYTPRTQSLAEAPLETLAALGVAQRLRLGKEVWERMSPGDCHDKPRLAPLTRSYPDFRKLTRREGDRHWTYVTYDIDSDGVPFNLATPFTTGDAALDAEARAAVAAGRYAGGPRTGCLQAWWSGAETIPAPPIPPKEDTEGNPACEIKDRWDREPRLVFPPSYQRRAVEGWAILRYDVAPWGEIGAIAVLDAQPSSEFGEAAVNVIRNARFKTLDTGLKGCIDRVIFRLRPKEGGEAESGTADPA